MSFSRGEGRVPAAREEYDSFSFSFSFKRRRRRRRRRTAAAARLVFSASASSPGGEASVSQLMHDNLGRLVDVLVSERYATLSGAERRVKVALDLAQTVELKTHKVLPDMNETFILLANIIEIMWRCGFDYDLRETTGPEFYAYPSVHPYAESQPGTIVDDSKFMRLENKEYQSSRFRRLHLELAKREDGLEVLRMVMFPRVRYDLPIVALDMVSFSGRVSFVIADASPVHRGRKLPDVYVQAMTDLRKKHLPDVSMARLPEWADLIFSEGCVCFRPRDELDISAFITYCSELINFHIEASSCFGELGEEEKMSEVYQCHQKYTKEQLNNEKTRKSLEASFGPSFTEAYMKQTLFDVEPGLAHEPLETEFGDEIEMNNKRYEVRTGMLARIENAEGKSLYVPKGHWTPGEEIAMLRLFNSQQ